jgi:hypothetical protein
MVALRKEREQRRALGEAVKLEEGKFPSLSMIYML